MKMSNEQRMYIHGQQRADFKPGDKVKVVRKAQDYQAGWGNVWAEKMDDAVGQIGEVIEPYSEWKDLEGITVGIEELMNFEYPYFVLEKVE